MAISLRRLRDLLDSNGSILMRMVLVFFPSFSVPYIAGVMLLFNAITEKVNHLVLRPLWGWIVWVMSKIQKTVLLYWQSTMRPLLDPVVEKMSDAWEDLMLYLLSKVRVVRDRIASKMRNASEALEMHLAIDAEMGQPKAKLVGKLALLSTTFFLQESELRFKYDKTGVITVCFISICLSLLTFSYYWSKTLEILSRRWGCTSNSTLNSTCFFLAICFENFYDNSLRNIGAAFCMAVFILSLHVVLRPRIDIGFFGLMLGVVGSMTYSHFGLKYPTWIISCICFVMIGFKSWLDKHWLDFEEDLPRLSTYINIIGSATMIAPLPDTWSFVTRRISRPAGGDGSILLLVICIYINLGGRFYFWSSLFRYQRHAPNDLLPTTRVGLPLTRVDLQTRYMNFVFYSSIMDYFYLFISQAYYDGWDYPTAFIVMSIVMHVVSFIITRRVFCR
ncbi:hypothetical protein SLEP1_g49134 [Rubroshorea leprosula]|uniref:Uncharacterized protein n=1 Tax=Rubroshorea leprosula TaxID=152421 RepID=A0AAV5LY22_9ROSI|nr:hypothetical protein SLEP1_g49134 [Rubroshorea leprosula]